jgi:hypothetical protein
VNQSAGPFRVSLLLRVSFMVWSFSRGIG